MGSKELSIPTQEKPTGTALRPNPIVSSQLMNDSHVLPVSGALFRVDHLAIGQI